MPYHPTRSESGRKIVVTMVRSFITRFCWMSTWAWYSELIWLAYSRSIRVSSRRASAFRRKASKRWAL